MQTNNYLREQYMGIEKPLMSSPESERIIITAVISNNDLMSEVVERMNPEMFYNPLHRRIVKAMFDLYAISSPIEVVLIGAEINKEYSLDLLGGIQSLMNVIYGVPPFRKLDKYIQKVADAFKAREFVKKCGESINKALAEEEEIGVTIDRHEGEIFKLSDDKKEKSYSNLGDNVETIFERIQENARSKDEKQLLGISTGYRDLDEVLEGLQKEQLIIIAARPSLGKTTLALNICQNVLDDEFFGKKVVLFFSLEMSKDQLAKKQLAADSKTDSKRLGKGFLMRDEWTKTAESVAKIKGQKLIIDDSPTLTPMEMRATARRVKAEEKQLDLIVVDYLQKMSGSQKKYDRRDLEIGEISKELKVIAKEMKVPVIALCQLNRECEKRKPPRPIMSDLGESSKIEADADVIAFIYREDYYYPDTTTNSGVAEILIKKNREGPTGTVKLTWLNYCTRFENLANL